MCWDQREAMGDALLFPCRTHNTPSWVQPEPFPSTGLYICVPCSTPAQEMSSLPQKNNHRFGKNMRNRTKTLKEEVKSDHDILQNVLWDFSCPQAGSTILLQSKDSSCQASRACFTALSDTEPDHPSGEATSSSYLPK